MYRLDKVIHSFYNRAQLNCNFQQVFSFSFSSSLLKLPDAKRMTTEKKLCRTDSIARNIYFVHQEHRIYLTSVNATLKIKLAQSFQRRLPLLSNYIMWKNSGLTEGLLLHSSVEIQLLDTKGPLLFVRDVNLKIDFKTSEGSVIHIHELRLQIVLALKRRQKIMKKSEYFSRMIFLGSPVLIQGSTYHISTYQGKNVSIEFCKILLQKCRI